ncbi:MAG: carbohydrate kinase family protein [Caldilineaceae bacterium]|nr:carbohydrate kinase family protein [Caldilineaceae bacterium]
MTVPDDRGRGILFGDVCVDLVLSVPQETGKARQQASPEVHGGGTVANTAVALARLGAKTHFVGVVGDDLFGREALEELVTEGIDVSCVKLSGRRPTMIVIALIDGTGQRTVLGWPRRDQAFTELNERQLDRLDLTARDWLHTSGVCMVQEHGRRATLRVLDRARARKVRSSFDLNLRLGLEGDSLPVSYVEALWSAIGCADFVLGSADEELFHLVPNEPDMRRATAHLAREGQCVAIMREGPVGAHVSEFGSPAVTIPPFRVPVADTLGAGDSFDAGFMEAGLSGCSLAEQVMRGHAVAALQIGRVGARSSPRRQELDHFLANRSDPTSGWADSG